MAVKKAPVKKSAKKPAAKKAPVKKPVGKKAPAKKPAVKKSVQKKAAVKKPVVKGKVPAPVKSSSLAAALEAARDHCDVLEMGGNSFVIVAGGARNFFDLEEMRLLVKLSHMASDEKDGAVRLHRWLVARRKDVINDTKIRSALDPVLVGIYRYLIGHYQVKE